MKDQCKKIFALHLRPDVSIPCYNIIAACKLSCKISRIKDTLQKISQINLRFYYLTLQHYFFYARTAYIRIKYSKKGSFEMSTYRQSRTSLIFFKNIFLNKFFLVSTLSSMGGVVCSAIVSEKVKNRKIARDSPANICWSWRRLQHVFSVTILRLPRRLEDVLRRRLEDVFKTSRKTSWRHLRDIFKTSWKTKNCYAQDVIKTSWRHVLKTSWRHVLKTSWRRLEDISWRRLQDVSEGNKIFTGDICI